MTVREVVLAFARNEEFDLTVKRDFIEFNGMGMSVNIDNDSLRVWQDGSTVNIKNESIKSLFAYDGKVSVYSTTGGNFEFRGVKND